MPTSPAESVVSRLSVDAVSTAAQSEGGRRGRKAGQSLSGEPHENIVGSPGDEGGVRQSLSGESQENIGGSPGDEGWAGQSLRVRHMRESMGGGRDERGGRAVPEWCVADADWRD
eukprot:311829-Chlamydomonas_euryale.AAC.2